jgi:Holliday junction DNA helicase RuvA
MGGKIGVFAFSTQLSKGEKMYSYMIGKVIATNKKTITFENNYIGYVIYVSDPTKFEINKIKKLYLYKQLSFGNKNNVLEEIYGFERYETKNLFMNLLQINGVGPKTAINICRNDSQLVQTLIAKHDYEGLCALENITPKFARLMVEHLCETYKIDEKEQSMDISSLTRALKSLGYKNEEIEYAIKNIDSSKNQVELSDLISQAIKVIAGQENASFVKTN